MTGPAAALPPAGMPGLDPGWSRLVVVEGTDGVPRTWHVLDNGTPDPVGTLLCVHGNPTWSYLWRGLLAAAPPGWRVIAPDQLGMGYSERLMAPRRLASRVADLRALTDALGVAGPVVTVGHDWGGAVTLGWALAAGTQLRGVVLANTAVAQPPGDHGPALVRLANLPVLRDAVCVRTPTFVRAATALTRPALSAGVRDAYAAPYGSAARRRSVGDFVADIPFAPNHPSRPALEAIAAGVGSLDVPALVFWGPRDPVFGQRYLRDLLQRLPDADLHRYEGASHLLPEDAPEYAAAVARWVADLGAGPDAVAHMSSPARRESRTAPDGRTPEPASRHALWSALERRADDPSPAVVEVGGLRVSWEALARRVRELAVGLATAGVRPGHRVALLVPPSAELTVAVYAVWRAGGVVVLADKGLGLSGMGRALRSANVDHVIGSGPGLAAAALMRLPGTRFAAGPVNELVLRALGATARLADLAPRGGSRSAVARQLPPEPGQEDDCTVIFTSGATGPAKGVVYRHRHVEAQLELLSSTYRLTLQDRFVAAFAPFALLGPALGISTAVPDIDVTKPGSLTVTDLADAVAAVDATVVFASPAALRTVVRTADDLSDAGRKALATVRLLVSAGAPVPASLLLALGPVLPAAEAHTPYGMTEVLPVTDICLAEILQASDGEGVCVGRPLPGVEVCISAISATGAADGTLASTAGVTGEVLVRAAHVKDRYDALWSTEQASSRDRGWHRTGDVGHLDATGRLWVEGRLLHVVTAADGVVTPVPVEQRVERLDSVAAAAVVGVGPPQSQVVVVVVVPSSPSTGSPLASPELASAVRGVAGVEVAAVLVRPELPLDIRHASKVDRRRLAHWATQVLQGRAGRGGPDRRPGRRAR